MATQITLPKDAEGREIPLDTECLYSQMDKSEFADFAPEYEGLYSCSNCGEETAVLACVNEGGDMEWMKPRFCGFCGAKVVEVVEE